MSASAETERKPKGNFLPSAETETMPKEAICQLSAPKPKPKPNFGRPLLKTGILLKPSPQILDVLENFHGRKNVRLGVNRNPAYSLEAVSSHVVKHWTTLACPLFSKS